MELYTYLAEDLIQTRFLKDNNSNLDKCFFKIATLTDCTVQVLPQTLSYDFNSYEGSLVTVETIPNEILLCFSSGDYKSCEDFDGQVSKTNPFKSNDMHHHGCMALYNKSPTIIGGGTVEEYTSKVETLGLGGWTKLQDHPRLIHDQSCTTIESDILTVGGRIKSTITGDVTVTNEIFLLRSGVWSKAGELKEVISKLLVRPLNVLR